jgi:hypothetical protein
MLGLLLVTAFGAIAPAGAAGAGNVAAVVSPTTPTLSIAASGPSGGSISGAAMLAGGASPTGSMTVNAYGPNDATCTSTPASTTNFAVVGNGTYTAFFQPPSAGTYQFVATYGGDANNAAVATACANPAGLVTVSSGPPSATTGAASSVTASTASLAAMVTPNGSDTKVVFEFGTSTAFGSITSTADVGAGFTPATMTGTLAGLAPRTTYLYRVVATNANGTAVGAVQSLTTGGAATAPVVVTSAASGVGNSGATLAGTVNPAGQATAFTFEYGTTTSFGSLAPVVELDSASSPEPVSAMLTGLASNTTYLYRVVATNATGTSSGAVGSFTTGPGGLPVVTTGAASSITANGATLSGTVDPHASPTSFAFEYGTTTSFGSLSAIDSAGSAPGVQSVSLPVGGLAPSTTYLYRIDATNANGTATGVVRSFTTAAMPAAQLRAALAVTCTCPVTAPVAGARAASAGLRAAVKPAAKPLRWAARGNRSLGTVKVAADSVVRWTDATGSFSVRDASGRLKASSRTKGGETFVARGTFRQVTVRAKGSWTLTITPLPVANR